MTELCAPVKCSLTAKAVLMWLAHHHNADTGRCDPSTETIAEEACMSTRTVRNALAELIESKILKADHRGGRSSNYTFNPGTRFRPEPDAPRNVVPPTPERGSAPPRNVVPKPRNVVPPNSKEQEEEQEKNSKRAKKLSSKEFTEREFKLACLVEISPLASDELKSLWQEFIRYRISRATERLTGEKIIPWTEGAAQSAAGNMEAWTDKHGIEAVKSVVRKVIEKRNITPWEPDPKPNYGNRAFVKPPQKPIEAIDISKIKEFDPIRDICPF